MRKICALMFGERRPRLDADHASKADAASTSSTAPEVREPRFYPVDVANYG